MKKPKKGPFRISMETAGNKWELGEGGIEEMLVMKDESQNPEEILQNINYLAGNFPNSICSKKSQVPFRRNFLRTLAKTQLEKEEAEERAAEEKKK